MSGVDLQSPQAFKEYTEEALQHMIKYFLKKIRLRGSFLKKRNFVYIPSCVAITILYTSEVDLFGIRRSSCKASRGFPSVSIY
jgi:hypothetical protein